MRGKLILKINNNYYYRVNGFGFKCTVFEPPACILYSGKYFMNAKHAMDYTRIHDRFVT